MKNFVLKLSDEDNVAVARKNLQKGDFGALSQIPFGHKISTRIIPRNSSSFGNQI